MATILVVDDEPEIRALTRETLVDFDYRVVQAATGEDAVRIYREQGRQIDGVVLDLNLPGMSGYQCLQELAAIDSSVRILVASGYVAPDQVDEMRAAGATDFIAKPFLLNELLEKVARLVDYDQSPAK